MPLSLISCGLSGKVNNFVGRKAIIFTGEYVNLEIERCKKRKSFERISSSFDHL